MRTENRYANIGYNVEVQDGHYGEVIAKRDIGYFRPYGRVVDVINIFRQLEDGAFSVLVRFTAVGGEEVSMIINRSEIAGNEIAKILSQKGASVSSRRADVLQEHLNLQCEQFQGAVSNIHSGLGWIDICGNNCFRAFRCRPISSHYRGQFDIQPAGSFTAWRKGMRDDVLPYPAMAFSLLAGLSSVLVGFLAPHVPLLNPIISLTGPSSSGKSTAGVVAASTAFRPVLGVNCGIDNLTGEQKQLIGGISSWAATRNALIARLQANQGFPVVLDELSKTELGDLSSIVYILSEGTDKDRLSKDCTLKSQASFHTSIISIGEERLIDRCQKKQSGLALRIFEAGAPFTTGPEHAERLVKVCRCNYGHAAPKLARTLSKYGVEAISDIYRESCKKAEQLLPTGAFRTRRAQTFEGLLLATAILAKEALGLNFDTQGLLNYMIYQEKSAETEPQPFEAAYYCFLDWLGVNIQHFLHDTQGRQRYGLLYERKEIPRRRNLPEDVSGEVAVFPSRFEEFCRSFNITNPVQLRKAWIAEKKIYSEQGKHTARRMIDGILQPVYIVRLISSNNETGEKGSREIIKGIAEDDLDDLEEDVEDNNPVEKEEEY